MKKALPPRSELLGQALAIASQFDSTLKLDGERTIINTVGGGLAGWINREYFPEGSPRSFLLDPAAGLTIESFLNQVYRSDAEQVEFLEQLRAA